MNRIKKPIHRAWRRLWGKDWLHQEMRRLWVKRLPWRIVCWVRGHNWGEKDSMITDGPIDVHPREREYYLLGFNQQCARCYDIRNVEYTEEEKAAAIEASIQEDLEEWPEVEKWFAERPQKGDLEWNSLE